MKEKAVALKYDAQKNTAPELVAKGEGESAKNIIKIATQHGVPIKKDEDLVEILSKVELNQEVPAEMYKAVAEVFSFIYKMTKK